MQRADVYDRRYDESIDQTDAYTCPECDGRVTMNIADTVCDDCGLVLADDGVDTGPEWRQFDDTENRKWTGAPRTMARHNRGLSTKIGWASAGQGTALSSRKRRRLSRLRTHQTRAQFRSTAECNEMYGPTEIRRMTGALGLGDGLRDRACRLLSTAQTEDFLRGRSIEAMVAASVYTACRCSSRPHTFGDIASVAQVPEQKVQNGYDVLNRELGLPVPPRDPELFLARFCSDLGFSPSVERHAAAVLERGETPETNGSNPAAVAAGAVLVAAEACNETARVTQSDVATVADVCVPTVRRYRDELEVLA